MPLVYIDVGIVGFGIGLFAGLQVYDLFARFTINLTSISLVQIVLAGLCAQRIAIVHICDIFTGFNIQAIGLWRSRLGQNKKSKRSNR